MTTNSKLKPLQLSKGFTLVEMLVVIAIIATLAGLSFPIAKTMINQGKEKETQLRMLELVTAVNDYNDDNGQLPYTGSTYPSGDQELSSANIVDLVNILLGDNAKSKKYLEMPAAKNKRNGIIYDTSGDADEIVDGWGKEFGVVIDYDLNSELDHSDIDETVEGQYIIILSKGSDDDENDDDVYSWKK